MRQSESIELKGQEHLVRKFKRSLYGLKQSPRCWNATLDARLGELGFQQTNSDSCNYRASEGEMFFIAIYVDDIILAGKSGEKMKAVKEMLFANFDMKDMGLLHHFLGVKVVQNQTKRSVWIGQNTLLERFGMENSKPVSCGSHNLSRPGTVTNLLIKPPTS